MQNLRSLPQGHVLYEFLVILKCAPSHMVTHPFNDDRAFQTGKCAEIPHVGEGGGAGMAINRLS